MQNVFESSHFLCSTLYSIISTFGQFECLLKYMYEFSVSIQFCMNSETRWLDCIQYTLKLVNYRRSLFKTLLYRTLDSNHV